MENYQNKNPLLQNNFSNNKKIVDSTVYQLNHKVE